MGLHEPFKKLLIAIAIALFTSSIRAIPMTSPNISDSDVLSSSTSKTPSIPNNQTSVGDNTPPICGNPDSHPKWKEGTGRGYLDIDCRFTLHDLLAQTPTSTTVFYDVRYSPPERIGPWLAKKAVPYSATYGKCTMIVAFRSQWAQGLIPDEVENWRSLPAIARASPDGIEAAYRKVNDWCLGIRKSQPGWAPVLDSTEEALAVYVVPSDSAIRGEARLRGNAVGGRVWEELVGNGTMGDAIL